MNPIYHYDHVYYVEALGNETINPVAIRPEIYQDKIQWLDTSKGKVVELGKIDNRDDLGQLPPNTIEITGKKGEKIRLIKLTLDIYNEKVKDKVMLPPTFNSDAEVQTFYLESDFEPY